MVQESVTTGSNPASREVLPSFTNMGEHCFLLGCRATREELGTSLSLLKELCSPLSSSWSRERGGLGQHGTLIHKRKGKVLLKSLRSQLFLFPKYVR